MTTCRVPGCVSLASETDRRVRNVCTIGICSAHQSLPDEELSAMLHRRIGLCGGLEPVTTRIEYDADGKPVRFYPEIRQ